MEPVEQETLQQDASRHFWCIGGLRKAIGKVIGKNVRNAILEHCCSLLHSLSGAVNCRLNASHRIVYDGMSDSDENVFVLMMYVKKSCCWLGTEKMEILL